MATCKDCLHYDVCMDFTKLKESEVAQNIDVAEHMCDHFKNKANYVEVDKVSEQIIRKQAEVSDYWQKDVVSYRAMQGYSNIEHDTDNFLRGYNEAVEDMLAILGERRDA